MKRRAFLKGFSASLLGPCLASAFGQTVCTASGVGAHSSGMNVLCIVIENLPAEAVGCPGNPAAKTSYLDRFADTALRFKRCYCQSPRSLLSRHSFLTGLRPDTTGAHTAADSMDRRPPEDRVSLPELMHHYGIYSLNVENNGARQAEHAAGLLQALAEEKRQFFMTLDLTPVCPAQHSPETVYGRNALENTSGSPAAPEQSPEISACGGLSSSDTQIGIVLEALDRAGLSPDTIVMIFSDRGAPISRKGLRHERPLSEQSTHVPLLIRVPGLSQEGGVCDELVELVDLFPTLCELLAIPYPEDLEGVSFLPLLSNPQQPWKLAAFTTCVTADHIGHSVRTKRWRYTDWQSHETALRQFELYDLRTDPGERDNLVSHPDCRTQRTILANLLQRGWPAASQRGTVTSAHQDGLAQRRCGPILR